MKQENKQHELSHHTGRGRILGGTIVIIVGVGLLLQNLFPGFSFNYIWPLIIIVVGLFLIFKRSK